MMAQSVKQVSQPRSQIGLIEMFLSMSSLRIFWTPPESKLVPTVANIGAQRFL